MLSPFEITKTIKDLHKKHKLDFHDINLENYQEFITRVIQDPALLNDLKIYAIYSYALSCNNHAVKSFLDYFCHMAIRNNDSQSIIELDNLIYPDNYFFLNENECIFDRAMTSGDGIRTPNEYKKHFYRKYYAFEKYSYEHGTDFDVGFSKNIDFIVNDILEGNLCGFKYSDIESLKNIIHRPSSCILLAQQTQIYMINPVALGSDPGYKRSVSLYFELMGNGLISSDMGALTLCFGDKQLFNCMLASLNLNTVSAITQNLFYLVGEHMSRKNVVADVESRIDRYLDSCIDLLVFHQTDVLKLNTLFGCNSIKQINNNLFRQALLNRIAARGALGSEALCIVLSQYEPKDAKRLADDISACPTLSSLLTAINSPMRRLLLEQDFEL